MLEPLRNYIKIHLKHADSFEITQFTMLSFDQKSISFKTNQMCSQTHYIRNFEICHLECAISIFPYFATALSIVAILEH